MIKLVGNIVLDSWQEIALLVDKKYRKNHFQLYLFIYLSESLELVLRSRLSWTALTALAAC